MNGEKWLEKKASSSVVVVPQQRGGSGRQQQEWGLTKGMVEELDVVVRQMENELRIVKSGTNKKMISNGNGNGNGNEGIHRTGSGDGGLGTSLPGNLASSASKWSPRKVVREYAEKELEVGTAWSDDDDLGGDAEGGGEPKRARSFSHNSTSSIYVSSTLRVPNNGEILLSVGSVINCIMVQTLDPGDDIPPISEQFKEFDERHWARLSLNAQETIPTQEQVLNVIALDHPTPIPSAEAICAFLVSVFELAEFSAECSTISLVLVNRLLTLTKMPLHQRTWRLVLLSSLLIAQKIWDDGYVANVDFPYIWKHAFPHSRHEISLQAFNAMESKFLSLLNFDVFVSGSLYAKYYFELRTLHDPNVLRSPGILKPLSKSDAERLEARSAAKASEFEQVQARKNKSDQDLNSGSQARAVLS